MALTLQNRVAWKRYLLSPIMSWTLLTSRTVVLSGLHVLSLEVSSKRMISWRWSGIYRISIALTRLRSNWRITFQIGPNFETLISAVSKRIKNILRDSDTWRFDTLEQIGFSNFDHLRLTNMRDTGIRLYFRCPNRSMFLTGRSEYSKT